MSVCMKRKILSASWVLTAVFSVMVCIGCDYDNLPENDKIYRFVTKDFTQLEKIDRISKFRSGEGHDYSDSSETCRSMKHYYDPKSEYKTNNEIEIYSPVDGIITELADSGHGASGELINKRIHIQSSEYQAYVFVLFHIDLLSSNVTPGKKVSAGEHIGYARMYYPDLDETAANFDIAVQIDYRKKVSFFDVMTDELFESYIARGATSRDDFIISKEERDAAPMTCDGEWFTGSDPLESYFDLN